MMFPVWHDRLYPGLPYKDPAPSIGKRQNPPFTHSFSNYIFSLKLNHEGNAEPHIIDLNLTRL